MKDFKFIFGRNGTEVYKQTSVLIKQQTQMKNDVILIVPDQYTLTAEQYYSDFLGEKNMTYIKIMSFKRFLHFVKEKQGTQSIPIGAGGKSVLVAKAYNSVKENLTYYKGYYHIGLIDALCEQISDLKLFGVTPDDLLKSSNENEKLKDIGLIYGAYDALLGDNLSDPDDNLKILAMEIEESGTFNNHIIFIDFFKFLNEAELGVVKSLYSCGADLTMTFLTEDLDTEYVYTAPLSSLCKRLERHIISLCGSVKKIHLKEQTRYANEELAFLDKNLYSDSNVSEKTDNIIFYRAADTADELNFIASEISRLVRDNGYRYNDFAIVTSDSSMYATEAEIIFSEYDIPVFYHRKSSVNQKTPTRFLLSLFALVLDGYTRENVFEFVRSGVLPITGEEISDFERYVNIWSVNYTRFLKPFTLSTDGFSQNTDEESLARLNKTRDVIVQVIEDFREKTQNRTVREISKAIFDLFSEVNMEGHLEEVGAEYKKYGESALYSENMAIYQNIIDALDQFVVVAGDDKMDLEEYRDLMKVLLSASVISIIPTSLDEVLSGDADKVPLLGKKCVFAYGLCEDFFPAAVDDEGLINESEREVLLANGVLLGRNIDEKVLYEQFIAYLTLTSPTEKLYLSYPSIWGDEKTPSVAFCEAKKLFPNIPIKEIDLKARIQRENPSFGLYTSMNIKELGEYFSETEYSNFMKQSECDDTLTPLTAKAVFKSDMKLSASKVDSFYQCRYKYFLQYALGIRSVKKADLSPVNKGTFIHNVLERVLSEEGWVKFDNKQMLEKVEYYMESYLNSVFSEESPSKSMLEYVKNLEKNIYRLLLLFREEFEQSKFKPAAFELKVAQDVECGVQSVNIEIENGKIHMTGVIDRVDSFEMDGINYLRVVDYKSGSKSFDFSNIYSGIDIQLLMYLYALKENGEKLFGKNIPAGALYVEANSDIQSVSRDEFKEPMSAKKIRTSGILLNDINVLSAMEDGLKGRFIHVVKPDAEMTASQKQFDIIFGYIHKILSDMGNELLAGEIKKNPVKYRKKGWASACDYCDLAKTCYMCGNEEWIPEYKKKMEFLSAVEVKEKGRENKNEMD